MSQDIEKIIDSFDTLTSVHIETDVESMRKDGQLRSPDEYSDDEFMRIVKQSMIDSNSDRTIITANVYLGSDKTVTQQVGIEFTLNGSEFSAQYLRPLAFISLYFTRLKRYRAYWRYLTNKRFQKGVQQLIQQLLWKTSFIFAYKHE